MTSSGRRFAPSSRGGRFSLIRRAGLGSVLAVAMAAGLIGAADSASATTNGTNMTPGQTMNRGESIVRANGIGTSWQLTLQGDGNLVLYYHRYYASDAVCFASNTVGRGSYAVYQGDGNFVLRDAHGVALWSSGTAGKSLGTIDINSQGRLYVGYSAITSKCPWYV